MINDFHKLILRDALVLAVTLFLVTSPLYAFAVNNLQWQANGMMIDYRMTGLSSFAISAIEYVILIVGLGYVMRSVKKQVSVFHYGFALILAYVIYWLTRLNNPWQLYYQEIGEFLGLIGVILLGVIFEKLTPKEKPVKNKNKK